MRFILQAQIPTEKGNEKIKDGSLFKAMESYTALVKPEATYFTFKDGKRAVYFVVDIPSVDKLPLILEPLWLNLEADITVMPAMTPEDFAKAGPDFEKVLTAIK